MPTIGEGLSDGEKASVHKNLQHLSALLVFSISTIKVRTQNPLDGIDRTRFENLLTVLFHILSLYAFLCVYILLGLVYAS
jgi:hypothetical protein